MSLSRKRTSTNPQLHKITNNSTKLKTLTKTKPIWDSTNSDLKQLRASNEEIEKRRIIHQSKNIDLIKFEKQQQLMANSSKKSQDAKAQLALLKEILYDDEQLKSLIHKSDSTLKTVKDFFNVDSDNHQINEKKPVKINMTLAPNVTDLNESNLPHNMVTKTKKKTILTNASINNANSLSDEMNDLNESDLIDYKIKQAKLNNDLDSYRHLLELKQEMIQKKLNSPILPNKNELDECLKLLTNKSEPNDTEKINRLKNLIKNYAQNHDENKQEEPKNQSLITNINDEFRRNLNELENKIIQFENESGKQSFRKYSSMGKQLTNSTCTQTLIKIVSVLLDYLKEMFNELNYEKLVHSESNKQLDIHRKLIDGLTNEILAVREQNEKVLTGYKNQQTKFESDLEQIKELLRENMYRDPPNIIDSKPNRPSAFKTHNIDSQRSLSCINYNNNSMNDLNQFRSTNSSFNNKNSNSCGDKFTERINAMLQNDLELERFKAQQMRPTSSGLFSCNTSQLKSSNDFNYENNLGNLLSNNKQIMNDFNSQIQELSNQNIQAQQKFKNIQSEHVIKPIPNDNALEKLKQEQQLIKEQINMLNKQRESAQIELEVLSLTSSSSNLNKLIKRSNNSPSLSPISLTDNIYPAANDSKPRF